MQSKVPWNALVRALAFVSVVGVLLTYMYMGIFTRYMADDYSTSGILREMGFWNAQIFWWEAWSGRYSFTFLVTFVEMFGLQIVPVLPALTLVLWVSCLSWAALPLIRSANLAYPVQAGVFIASSIIFSTIRSIVDYPQIVFWQTGILTYPISLMLFSLFAGIILRRVVLPAKIYPFELFIWFLLGFIAGGFSETGVAVQIALCVVCIFALLLTQNSLSKKKGVTILSSMLAGSVLGLIVITIAPGSSSRAGDTVYLLLRFENLLTAFVEAVLFLPKWINDRTLPAGFAFLAGAFLAYQYSTDKYVVSFRWVWKVYLFSFVLMLASVCAALIPSYLLRGILPPERALVIPYFLVSCCVSCWGWLTLMILKTGFRRGAHFMRLLMIGLFFVGIILGPISSTLAGLELIPILKTYSSLWDKRHQSILLAVQQNEHNVVVTDLNKNKSLSNLRLKLWLQADFEPDEKHWVNQAAARYYGLDSLSVK